ncbi:MAG: hypothetical protein ACLFPE_06655, partial [Bacteroidales bacterium]
MKNLLLIILILIANPEKNEKPEIDEIRRMFFTMDREQCGTLLLFRAIESDSYSDPLLQAYAGATEAASAECVDGAFNKLESFSRGKNNLEDAVERDPQNPEIRFLRFATQVNLPNFITYDNIRDDKTLILNRLPQLLGGKSNEDFWVRVAEFMAATNALNKNEKKRVEQLLQTN